MKNLLSIWCMCVVGFPLSLTAQEREEITFKAEDGLEITADLYFAHEDKKTPFIILFHQARWSRGEYLEIAPKLNRLGFNCMAVDQRSGGAVNKINNKTFARAREAGKGVNYLDALPDMQAAVKCARKQYAQGKLIVLGSSYSASLVVKMTGDLSEEIDGVISFAPGDYFNTFGKPSDWVRQSAKNIHVPILITSARREKAMWEPIYAVIPSKKKTSYLPKGPGKHGASALWEKTSGHEGYWEALEKFLKEHFIEE